MIIYSDPGQHESLARRSRMVPPHPGQRSDKWDADEGDQTMRTHQRGASFQGKSHANGCVLICIGNAICRTRRGGCWVCLIKHHLITLFCIPITSPLHHIQCRLSPVLSTSRQHLLYKRSFLKCRRTP